MKPASLATLFCVLVGLSLSRAADETPKAKLDAARTKYQKEMTAYREEVKTYFEQREEAARKDGNKKLLDTIKNEKNFFDESDAVPKSATKLSQKAAEIRTALEKSYGLAVKEYTKAKLDDEAAQTEHEMKAFSNLLGTWVDPKPGGHAFIFRFGGEMSEFDAERKPHTTGEWGVDKTGKVTVNLNNGHTLCGPIPKMGSFRLDVIPPGSTTATFTLNIRRVLK